MNIEEKRRIEESIHVKMRHLEKEHCLSDTIIMIQGTRGSGKSELVQQFIDDYNSSVSSKQKKKSIITIDFEHLEPSELQIECEVAEIMHNGINVGTFARPKSRGMQIDKKNHPSFSNAVAKTIQQRFGYLLPKLKSNRYTLPVYGVFDRFDCHEAMNNNHCFDINGMSIKEEEIIEIIKENTFPDGGILLLKNLLCADNWRDILITRLLANHNYYDQHHLGANWLVVATSPGSEEPKVKENMASLSAGDWANFTLYEFS